MPIKGIFFDAADVFYYRPQSTDSYVAALLEERGWAAGAAQVDRARLKELRSQAYQGRTSPEFYWDQVLALYGVPAESRAALAAEILAYADRVLPIAGGPEALAGLKERGFFLGIVTDTLHSISRKMRWLEAVGVAGLIDLVACSSALGVHKPDPAIYLYAVNQAGLPPGDSAFVGHDAEELDGARRAGLATVAVNYDPDATADFYARSLLDLLNVPFFQSPRA